MPKRSYSGAGSYRYGFNGKENDNDVKGLGNSQDYGMRIYDVRLGRFLSVDPLATTYPWYSPYHFAGNSPISNLDIDGGEPTSFIKDWVTKPLFDLRSGRKIAENSGNSKTIDDPQLGYVDVELVYDSWTKKSWFVHSGNNGQYYFLKNDDGNHSELTLKGGTIQVKGGHFEPFETQNAFQAKLGAQVADNIGLAVFVAFASYASVEALPEAAAGVGELWIGAHTVPEFIPYFGLLGGMSAVGLAGVGGLTEPANLKPTIEQLPIPEEVGPSPANPDKGLVNPYKNMTLSEVEAAMERQVVNGKLIPKPSAPGNKAYQNTKSKYSYNLDPGSVGKKGKKENPHVDVNYPNQRMFLLRKNFQQKANTSFYDNITRIQKLK